MIGFRALTALALACAASVVACSSSSNGSATKFACADQDPNSAANQPCVSCLKASCASELTTAFGSGYTSGDLSGGDCGSFTTCSAACACHDNTCTGKCFSAVSSPCAMAETAFGTCEQSMCGTQCAGAFGAGGGGGGDGGTLPPGDDGGTTGTGGSTGACDMTGSMTCIVSLSASQCSTAGGTTRTSCPTAGLGGCCTAMGIETCFYSQTASDVMMVCSALMGTFSDSP